MSAPNIYMWTDAGAPQVKYNDIATYQAMFQAVLVDGYGSKAPPGTGAESWTIPYSGADGFILKQGGTNANKCCLKIHTLSGNNAKAEVALNYSDYTTPVDKWWGYDTERVALGYATSTNNIPWVIFATKRTIIVCFGLNEQSLDTTVFDTRSDPDAYNYHWAFGDYALNGATIDTPFFIIGSVYTASDSIHMRAAITSQSSSYSSKMCYTDIGGQSFEPMVNTRMGTSNYWIGRPNNGLPSYPNNVNTGLYLQKPLVSVQETIMGELPGIVYPIQERIPQRAGGPSTIPGSGEFAGENLYVFNTYLGQFFVRDGEWGVE